VFSHYQERKALF